MGIAFLLTCSPGCTFFLGTCSVVSESIYYILMSFVNDPFGLICSFTGASSVTWPTYRLQLAAAYNSVFVFNAVLVVCEFRLESESLKP